jgi:hypothetical protein
MEAPLLGLLGATGLLAFLFAKVEIQIEGSDGGWAANLPTWRIEKHWLLDVFFGGRPLTGYHAWCLPFVLAAFHLPFALTWTWSLPLEARAMAAFMLFWIIEDFLWFLLNPAWGWRRFNRTEVRWHKHWLLGFPTDYWTFAVAAGFLLWYGYRP